MDGVDIIVISPGNGDRELLLLCVLLADGGGTGVGDGVNSLQALCGEIDMIHPNSRRRRQGFFQIYGCSLL